MRLGIIFNIPDRKYIFIVKINIRDLKAKRKEANQYCSLKEDKSIESKL